VAAAAVEAHSPAVPVAAARGHDACAC